MRPGPLNDFILLSYSVSVIPTLEHRLAGAAKLRLSNAGISLPSDEGLGSLLFLVVTSELQHGTSFTLPNLATVLMEQNGTLQIGSLSIGPQQLSQLLPALDT